MPDDTKPKEKPESLHEYLIRRAAELGVKVAIVPGRRTVISGAAGKKGD